MTYYMNRIVVKFGPVQRNLNTLVQNHWPLAHGDKTDSYHDHVIVCPAGSRVLSPDDGQVPLKPLARIHVRAGMAKARTITGPRAFDPILAVPNVKVRDVATNEEKTFNPQELALGIDTEFT